MENTASILILISGFAHAVVNSILKAGNDKMSRRALIDGFSALLLGPAAFFVPLPTNAWNWLIASAMVHGLYLLALIKSFEQSDMTVAYPIARGIAPMMAAAGAVALFHESISTQVVVGIVSIAVGVMFIGGALGVFCAIWRGRDFFRAAAGQWRPGLIAGALLIVTYGLALFAFRLGATPRLAALRETSILFGTAIAVIFLKERLTVIRTAGIVAIAAGAMLLVAVR